MWVSLIPTKKFLRSFIRTTLKNKAILPFGDEIKNIRVVGKTKLNNSVGSLESESMKYTVFRNLKRRRLLKDLEEEYIHEKRAKYDSEGIENVFVRSC